MSSFFEQRNVAETNCTVELQQLLDTLRRNKENVPASDLNGKYKVPYSELKEKISFTAKQLRSSLLSGFWGKKESMDEATDLFNKYNERFLDAIWKEYSATNAAEAINGFLRECIEKNLVIVHL